MKAQLLYSPYFRSLLGLGLSCFILWLFPSPAFDACFPYQGGQFGCGVIPDVLAGFVFILVCLVIGPSSKWHYIIMLLVFCFLGIAELIRFGDLDHLFINVLHQEFYYGGAFATALYLLIKYSRFNRQCT